MLYKTTREIIIEQGRKMLVIPADSEIYKIPNDHMKDNRNFNHYNWNGEIIAIEKDSNSVRKV